ncbi:type IIA DNA topoisomerase subunit B [Paraburkholderia sp. UCT31]|uniref:DNA topoisomerase IV subunit B n=1 Tax=Paraburkholderia sp. UCT31 TaxID=2615209 RepID=UPI0016557460|nr:DNA topoisomerase IV subunit B [Paraburkholderia sp. UCT31]MBC8737259.1 type IIA DNA topoisomerase subunit B [Paraburkholderia sp. UCT31]
MTNNSPPVYDESKFKILKGLEPVKKRPGMYTRVENPLHIVQEVIDNSADEALAGFAHNIDVEIQKDGSIIVTDDGRGIPVELHKDEGIPVVQAAFTMLHAGGKFDKDDPTSAYRFSGGLHGVGVAVTNALSTAMTVDVWRGGHQWRIGFAGGDVIEPLNKVGDFPRKHGTRVKLKPDAQYFDSVEVPLDALKSLLQTKAALFKGLTCTLTDATGAEPTTHTWQYENGLESLLTDFTDNDEPVTPVLAGHHYMTADDEGFPEGAGAEWAFGWYNGVTNDGQSFTNMIQTPEHGTHVNGMRTALYEAVKTFIEHRAMLPKGVKLQPDDVFKNVRYVLSARVLDPQFKGQTKDALQSRDAVRLVDRSIRPHVEAWLNLNPTHGKTIADLCIQNAVARSRKVDVKEKRKSSSVVMLPGKLADCESKNEAETELFLVEGDSAGGSAKMGRNKENQAILAMRGKGLNTWELEPHQVQTNNEASDIALAIGVPMHGAEDEVDWSGLRYGKICILADADVDGFHIQVLLLTLFYKHFPQLIARGHIHVARPPLYRVDAEAAGKKRPERKHYAMDDNERKAIEDALRKEGYSKLSVVRFKGLGEMNAEQLWDTTLNPDTRRLLKVTVSGDLVDSTREMFGDLMSKSRAGWRKEWMERRGHEVEAE